MRRKQPAPLLSIDDAVEILRTANPMTGALDRRLVKMSSGDYFVMPGGPVEAKDALKIIERTDVQPVDDPIFGGNPRWRLGQ